MHNLSLELAEVSDAIARTMAEAAAASILAASPALPQSPLTTETPISGGPSATDANEDISEVRDSASISGIGQGLGKAEDAGGSDRGAGRSRAAAQTEVEKLKARQSEMFVLLRDLREVRRRLK